MKLLFVFFTSFVAISSAVNRKLTHAVNPGCPPDLCYPEVSGTHINVVYIEAVGANDTVHYLWSTHRVPTILIFRTELTSVLSINWDDLLQFKLNGIQFKDEHGALVKPLQVSAFVVNELYEFKDDNDVANLHKSSEIHAIGVADFIWDSVNDTLTFTENFVKIFPKASVNATVSDQKPFETQFSVSANVEASDEYPHLHFSSNSSQMKLVLNNFSPTWKKSRFAAEVVAISWSKDATDWKNDNSISINDEYSPGVFKVSQLYSTCSVKLYNSNCREYLLWKPVAYIGKTPTVANSTDAIAAGYQLGANIPSYSIASSYFHSLGDVRTSSWNMTFGSSGDGFYTKTKFTTWTVMIGLGDPVMDKMSLLAIIVISVGLGAPMLMTLGGIAFLAVKKLRKKNDDPLLDD